MPVYAVKAEEQLISLSDTTDTKCLSLHLIQTAYDVHETEETALQLAKTINPPANLSAKGTRLLPKTGLTVKNFVLAVAEACGGIPERHLAEMFHAKRTATLPTAVPAVTPSHQ